MTVTIVIDHRGYLAARPHRRAVHAALRRLEGRGATVLLRVDHEHDDSCCRREAWPLTAARMVRELHSDGLRVAWLFADAGVAITPPDDAAEAAETRP